MSSHIYLNFIQAITLMKKYFNLFEEHKELSLVFLILCVLAMIIVPIPHQLMDVLIGVNIGLTIIVLMVVINMKTPLELTSFPSILLVLALFRIGITISTSRLILLDGDAGQIIETFGNFVVGGNLVVGVIIFSIITLVNFIVITKGSERVAEVAARFSLDAMPGKQMSIDSDLRAGNIDMPEAQRKRSALGLESKLYGAMDGAMKFVKGDSIASMIDIVINIVGGLIIGMAQHSLSFGDALTKYTILTVGDGLVQQIPALLISLTAGMMITRVSDDDSKLKENLGRNMINQVFKSPRALFSSSILFLLMAIIPGMPTSVFVVLFGLIAGLAFYLHKRTSPQKNEEQKMNKILEEANDQAQDPDTDDFVSWKLQPLVLHLSVNLKTSPQLGMIKKALTEVRRDILVNLGVEIPQIIIRYVTNLDNNSYQMLIYEISVASGQFYPEHIVIPQFTNEVEHALEATEIIPNKIDIGLSDTGVWINQSLKSKAENFGITYLIIEDFITMHLSKILKENVAEFFGMQEVKNLLDKMNEYQDLIKELLRMLPLNKITEILQRLLAENVSIRNFKIILNSMLEWSQREKEVIIIVEYIRQSLGRYIANKYSNGTYVLSCFLLDSGIEDMIRDSVRFNDRGSFLAIDPNIAGDIITKLRKLCDENSHLKITPVIIAQMDVRRYLRSIIEKELPFLHVLSFQEVESHVKFNSLAVVEL